MWAVLYGWTPEIFDTEGKNNHRQLCSYLIIISVRGTACGTASALSRMCVRIYSCVIATDTRFLIYRGGMIAPILGGALLQVNTSLPVYTSIVVFTVAGLCTVLLKGREGKRVDGISIVH